MSPDLTQYHEITEDGKNAEGDEVGSTLEIMQEPSPPLTQLDMLLLEIQNASGYNRINIDSKEVDSENESMLKGARLRVMVHKKILIVVIKIPRSYPEEPIKFSHGSM
jgi:hypothetical protein